MNQIIAASILAGAILILSVVLYFNYCQRQKVRAQVEQERREREASEQRKKLRAEQKRRGELLFIALKEAAQGNTLANVLQDGRQGQHVGLIEVECLPENGKLGFSIFVSMPDPTCATMGGLQKAGYPLMQVNVNLERTGKEIRAFKAPYGPERDYSLDEFDTVKSALFDYMRKYRLFGDERPSDEVFVAAKGEVR